MPSVAISSSTQLSADAAAEVARAGGNAVDAAVAASIVSAISEPGMVALGSGGYITVWPEAGSPVAIDGGVEMPGRGQPPERFGQGGERVRLDYFGGVDVIVGAGTVATPGAVAAWAEASTRYGRLPWRELLAPALAVARDGFPLPATSFKYLSSSHQKIFGRQSDSFAALHDADGHLLRTGQTVHMAGLTDTLAQLAEEGADAFYRGDLALQIAAAVEQGGGLLSLQDLDAYAVRTGPPVQFSYGDWHAATAAPSSIGGVLLAAMMTMGKTLERHSGWSPEWVAGLIALQNAAYSCRANRLDGNPQFEQAALDYLEEIKVGAVKSAQDSASTVHTSVVDSSGLACSVTISAGYGSGVMPAGSGFWLNNCLGEMELNCGGFHSLPPGTRLLSCMAPTVARHKDGRTLSIGSPGSARIITAQLQTLLNAWQLGLSLQEAVARPRVHVEPAGFPPTVAFEPGIGVPGQGIESRPFAQLDTYFGGIGAALRYPDGRLETVTDPRRSGAATQV